MAGKELPDTPEELRPHFDFTANMLIVILGYIMRRVNFIKDEHIPGLRFLTFGICLPFLIGSAMWTAQFQAELIQMVPLSMMIQTTTLLLAYFLPGFCVLSRELRGFTSMAVVGQGMSYCYGAVLDVFGPNGLSALLLWDVGGNLWAVIFAMGFIANNFSPLHERTDHDEAEQLKKPEEGLNQIVGATNPVEVPGERAEIPVEERSVTETKAEVLELDSVAVAVSPVAEVVREVQSNAAQDARTSRLNRAGSIFLSRMPVANNGKAKSKAGGCWQTFMPVLKLPFLWGAALGIFLNVTGVPHHYIPLKISQALASCFPVLLYLLLGSVIKFSMGAAGYKEVILILLFRYTISGAFAAAIQLSPLDDKARSITIFCLVCPIASPFLMYTGDFGYSSSRAAMVYNLSAVVAIVLIFVWKLILLS